MATDREPCPYRIVEDAGGAYAFGLVGGGIWHTFGGLRNAPRGQMIRQALARVSIRAPITAGSFAIWGMLFSGFDCTFSYMRRVEDPWNAIMSGAATGGVLAMRAGAKAAGRNAVVGGVVMAAIEGLSLVLNRVLMPMFEKQQMEAGMEIDMLSPPKDPTWISHRRSKREPLFQPSSSGSLLYSPPGSSAGEGAGKAGGFQEGFTLDSVGTADMHSSEWELKQKREKEEAEAASSTEQKPFWKVW